MTGGTDEIKRPTKMDHKNADGRTEILKRIAAANRGHPPLPEHEIREMLEQLPRNYQHKGALPQAEVLELFEKRLIDYDAHVEHCTADEISRTVGSMLRLRGLARIAVPAGFPKEWLPSGPEIFSSEGVDALELASCEGVLTGATAGIAETGTVVLQGVPGQGRRADTLVPEYHLCVVLVADVVQTVPEAFLRLKATKVLPTTFISGPSATADIEMTRIKGVHGPRVFDVLLVH